MIHYNTKDINQIKSDLMFGTISYKRISTIQDDETRNLVTMVFNEMLNDLCDRCKKPLYGENTMPGVQYGLHC